MLKKIFLYISFNASLLCYSTEIQPDTQTQHIINDLNQIERPTPYKYRPYLISALVCTPIAGLLSVVSYLLGKKPSNPITATKAPTINPGTPTINVDREYELLFRTVLKDYTDDAGNPVLDLSCIPLTFERLCAWSDVVELNSHNLDDSIIEKRKRAIAIFRLSNLPEAKLGVARLLGTENHDQAEKKQILEELIQLGSKPAIRDQALLLRNTDADLKMVLREGSEKAKRIAHYQLGVRYLDQKNFPNATFHLRHAILRDPKAGFRRGMQEDEFVEEIPSSEGPFENGPLSSCLGGVAPGQPVISYYNAAAGRRWIELFTYNPSIFIQHNDFVPHEEES